MGAGPLRGLLPLGCCPYDMWSSGVLSSEDGVCTSSGTRKACATHPTVMFLVCLYFTGSLVDIFHYV